MSWQRSSTVGPVPDDPVGATVAESIAEMLRWSTVELRYSPDDAPAPPQQAEPATASATGPGPPGWRMTLTVRLRSRIAPLVTPASAPLLEMLSVLERPLCVSRIAFLKKRHGNAFQHLRIVRLALKHLFAPTDDPRVIFHIDGALH